jgi:hypothetical protein
MANHVIIDINIEESDIENQIEPSNNTFYIEAYPVYSYIDELDMRKLNEPTIKQRQIGDTNTTFYNVLTNMLYLPTLVIDKCRNKWKYFEQFI